MTSSKPRRRNSIPQAKNIMRRCLNELLDPSPASIDAVWQHFESRCAYCRRELDRDLREGHMDHADVGGGNQLGNLVLSCGACNGDEKRDAPWREFLLKKAPTQADFVEREARILNWFEQHPTEALVQTPEIKQAAGEIEALIDAFGTKCTELKKLVAEQLLNPGT